MWAHWERVFQPGARAGSGIEVVIDLKMVIISYVLRQMVLASEAICASMTLAIFAWKLGITSVKRFQMAIENIKPGK